MEYVIEVDTDEVRRQVWETAQKLGYTFPVWMAQFKNIMKHLPILGDPKYRFTQATYKYWLKAGLIPGGTIVGRTTVHYDADVVEAAAVVRYFQMRGLDLETIKKIFDEHGYMVEERARGETDLRDVTEVE